MTTQDTGRAPAETVVANAAAAPPRRRRRRSLLALVAVIVLGALAAATTLYVRSDDGLRGLADRGAAALPDRPGAAAPAPARAPVATPVVALVGLRADGALPWASPLSVSATDGTLSSVQALAPDGTALPGALGADGTWQSTAALFPSTTYQLTAAVRDAAGETRQLPLQATTTAPSKTFTASLLPADGAVVGVGQALSVRLGTAVKDPAVRAEVEKGLTVTATPAVQGAWHWMSSTELRYRGPDFWAAGTKITMTAALGHVQIAPGVWGSEPRTTSVSVGDALTSVVDTQAHTMTVSQNGVVVRTMPASMGKPRFDTRNGTFVVLEKFADRVMDSSTVDLPAGTAPYRTAVKDAVRITNSGTFTHGAPWSVRSQGVRNVSHGCINLSPADADWYFNQVRRGDVVTVVGSTVGPDPSDAGSQDWNMTFEQWKAGSALS